MWCLMQIPVFAYFAFTVYIVYTFDSHVFGLCLATLQLGMFVLIPLPDTNHHHPSVTCCLLTIVLCSQLAHLIYGILVTLYDVTHIDLNCKNVKLGYVIYSMFYYGWVIFVLNVCYVNQRSSHSTKVHTKRGCSGPCAKMKSHQPQHYVISAKNPIMRI